MPGDGSVKCACGRSFATKQALQQHKSSGSCRGGGGAKPKPPRKVNKGASSNIKGAPLSVGVRIAENARDSAVLSGVDRIAHVENVAQFTHGQVVMDELLSASSFARLARVAGAYQKIRYRKLVFRVVPMLATTVSGGYVAAFVRDPADMAPAGPLALLNWITSQQGSVTTKWWQTAELVCPVGDRTYYTSSSEEVREYSPGRLVVVADGRSSAAGAMTVFADWHVSLEHASLEAAVSPTRPDHTTVLRNIWTKDANMYVWSYDPSKTGDSGTPNPDFMFSDWAVGDLFLLSSAFTLMEYKSGTSGDSEVENFWILHVESTTGVRWRIHPDTTDSSRAAADDVLIVPRGTVLRRVEANSAKYLNLQRARRCSSARPNGTGSSSIIGPSSGGSRPLQRLSPTRFPGGTVLPSPRPEWTLVLDTLRDCLTEFRQHSQLLRDLCATGRPMSSRESSFGEIPSEDLVGAELVPTSDGPGN